MLQVQQYFDSHHAVALIIKFVAGRENWSENNFYYQETSFWNYFWGNKKWEGRWIWIRRKGSPAVGSRNLVNTTTATYADAT